MDYTSEISGWDFNSLTEEHQLFSFGIFPTQYQYHKSNEIKKEPRIGLKKTPNTP